MAKATPKEAVGIDFDHLPSPMLYLVQTASDKLSFPQDQVVLVLLLIVSLFIGAAFRTEVMLKAGPKVRLYVSLGVGLLWTYFMHGLFNTVSMVVISLGNYALAYAKPTHPVYVTIFSMTSLSCFHIHRMYVDYLGWRQDVTLPMMIFTAKYIMFAYEVYDGTVAAKKETLTGHRLACAVSEMPSVVEFLSYIFAFFGAIMGPAFQLREYLDFIALRGDFQEIVQNKQVSYMRPALRGIAWAIFTITTAMIAKSMFPVKFLLSDEFLAMPIHLSWPYYAFSTCINRQRYFFGWYLAECACNLSGFGLVKRKVKDGDKETTEITFDRVRGGNVIACEFAPCFPQLVSNWNITISNWLKYYIYQRAERPAFLAGILSERNYAIIITRTTSAFWHGFYPGYYMFFLSTVLQSNSDTVLRNRVGPLWPKSLKWLYTFLGWFGTFMLLNYFGAAIFMLEVGSTWQTWKNVYFFGHLICLGIWVIVPKITPDPAPRPKKQD